MLTFLMAGHNSPRGATTLEWLHNSEEKLASVGKHKDAFALYDVRGAHDGGVSVIGVCV